MTAALQRIAQSRAFRRAAIAAILAAAAVVGLETSEALMARHGALLRVADWTIMGLFALEILIRIGALGRSWPTFFRDPWNVFDFAIVAVCLLPLESHFAAVLRLVRILRVLRLVSALPRLQFLVGALLKSISSMGSVGLLLLILFYMYAVMGVSLFGDSDPRHFGSIPLTMLTLFRVITLEGWTDIMDLQLYPADTIGQPATQALGMVGPIHPALVIMYFVSFILIGTMIMLNLFIGIILNGMTEMHAEIAAESHKEAMAEQQRADLDHLERQAASLLEQVRHLRAQGRPLS
ncbi:MAG: ion transporter [Verrucomicrobiae bacterium]|nr:ion transporter [Verrucomicrobiae bacterium]